MPAQLLPLTRRACAPQPAPSPLPFRAHPWRREMPAAHGPAYASLAR